MSKENISREFSRKNINETRNYLFEEIIQDELISKNHKNVCRVLNYIEHILILNSTVSGCVFIYDFAFLVGILIGITSSAIVFKICIITTV